MPLIGYWNGSDDAVVCSRYIGGSDSRSEQKASVMAGGSAEIVGLGKAGFVFGGPKFRNFLADGPRQNGSICGGI